MRVLGRAAENPARAQLQADHAAAPLPHEAFGNPGGAQIAAAVARQHLLAWQHRLDRFTRPIGHRDRGALHHALVIITHDERRAFGTHQQPDPRVLDRIGVLELIHQHVTEAGAIMPQYFRLVAPQLEGAQQQFGKVDHPGAGAGLLVLLVQSDQLQLRRIVAAGDLLRTPAFVLVLVDEVLQLARHPAGLVQVLRLQQFFDQPQLVLGVQDLKALR